MKIGEFFSNLPTLETERIRLRRLSKEDANDIFEYAKNENTAQFLPWYSHRVKQDSVKFVDSVLENYSKGYVAPWGVELKKNNKIIGTAGFTNVNVVNNSAEFGFVISEGYRNKGFATEAAKIVLEYGFTELDIHRIEAHCDERNEASSRVLTKIGMKYEGTLRDRYFLKDKYVSVKMFSMLDSEFKSFKILTAAK